MHFCILVAGYEAIKQVSSIACLGDKGGGIGWWWVGDWVIGGEDQLYKREGRREFDLLWVYVCIVGVNSCVVSLKISSSSSSASSLIPAFFFR